MIPKKPGSIVSLSTSDHRELVLGTLRKLNSPVRTDGGRVPAGSPLTL
jgi:hypothetical protein